MNLHFAYKALFWIWVGSEILLQVVTRTSRSQGQVKDRGSLLLMFPIIFATSWWASWYGDTHANNMPGPDLWYRAAGLALLIAGLAIRWTAILTLGSSFSTNVAIHSTQKLERSGLYHWVRHPSYTGLLIVFLAIGIRERNWVSLAAVLVLPVAAMLYRIHVEELALAEAFGADYEDYCKTTRRLVPGVY